MLQREKYCDVCMVCVYYYRGWNFYRSTIPYRATKVLLLRYTFFFKRTVYVTNMGGGLYSVGVTTVSWPIPRRDQKIARFQIRRALFYRWGRLIGDLE